MMNLDWKEKWITALRSGEYEQGQGELKTFDGAFCCLGVLLDVAGDTWRAGCGAGGQIVVRPASQLGQCLLSDSNKLKFQLPTSSCDHLMCMNDSGKSFSEIADWIDENL